jgi:hypothetical protein
MKRSKVVFFIMVVLFFNLSVRSQATNSFEFTLASPHFVKGTANQAVNIQFPSVRLWGWIEVTITSGFSNQLSTGKLTKRYEIGHNVGGYFKQHTEVLEAFGSVATQWYIGDFNHDTNSIPIHHLVTSGNALAIKIEGVLIDQTEINTIKTSTTISPVEIVAFSGTRQYMSIMQDRVGIGTNTPDAQLAVNGTIHSKEVKVDMDSWPDFVFKKEYSLPTLNEVETHIKEKGYLINLPSEAEVKKEGVNLGDMNAKLLQKIEELTLYMIDVNKKVNELQTSNSKLVEDNKTLQIKIKKLEE